MKLFARKIATGPNAAQRRSNVAITHGFLGSSGNWGTVASRLADNPLVADRLSTMYALDMRNHGASPHAPQHSNALMASDLERFAVDHMVGGDAVPHRAGSSVFIGHSMGGAVVMNSLFRRHNEAMLRAAAHDGRLDDPQDNLGAMDLVPGGGSIYNAETTPGHISAAIIVDITPTSQRPATFDLVQSDLNAMKALDLSKVKTVSDGTRLLEALGVSSSQIRNFLMTNLVPSESTPGTFEWKCNLDILHRDFSNILMSLDPVASALSFRPCPIPVLFVFGERSPYYQNAESRARIQNYFSNVEEVVIPDAGHFVHYEKMGPFVDAVAPFLYEHMGLV